MSMAEGKNEELQCRKGIGSSQGMQGWWFARLAALLVACGRSPQHKGQWGPGLPGGLPRSEQAAVSSSAYPSSFLAVDWIILWWRFVTIKAEHTNAEVLKTVSVVPSCIGWPHAVSPAVSPFTWSKNEQAEGLVGRTMKNLAKSSELTAAEMRLADVSFLFENMMQTFFVISICFTFFLNQLFILLCEWLKGAQLNLEGTCMWFECLLFASPPLVACSVLVCFFLVSLSTSFFHTCLGNSQTTRNFCINSANVLNANSCASLLAYLH